MKKLNRQQIKDLILKEISKVVDEEKLINLSDLSPADQRKFTQKSNHHDVCEQCGSNYMEEGDCMECGYSMNNESVLQEGDCGGCGCCPDCEAIPVYGLGSTMINVDFPKHQGVEKHRHNNYMAKPALYKVAKYSYKLLQMIPDGYELDDWQRTKIAQISDDISEVYHSLDYDFSDRDFSDYDDDC